MRMAVPYEKIEIFNNNLSTLKETSKDTDSKEVSYMTESTVRVVCFDKVKDEYIRGMKLSKTPCSTDALYLGKKDKICFIEFKNGKMSKAEIYNVYNKIYDSLLMFTDIIDQSVTYCRNNVDFILVYNESKNPKEKQDSAKVSIGKYLAAKAKKKFVRFDLGQFERLYFREVFTYTEKEFEELFLSAIQEQAEAV